MDARAKRAIVTCLEELQQKEVLVFTETITKHHPRLRSSPCLLSAEGVLGGLVSITLFTFFKQILIIRIRRVSDPLYFLTSG